MVAPGDRRGSSRRLWFRLSPTRADHGPTNVPLARAFEDRRFVLAGSLLAGVCLASLLWTPPLRMAIAGIGAGVVLWSFALWTSLRQAMPAELPARLT